MDTIISIYVLCFFARQGAVRALGKQAEGGDYGGQSDCDSVDAIGQALIWRRSSTLPPLAVVFTVTVFSTAKRLR